MQKYIYLAHQILAYGAQTLEELRTGWAVYDARGKAMAISTFYDNRRLLSERFGILLAQDKSRRYHLQKTDQESAELLLRMVEGATTPAPSSTRLWQSLLEEAYEERFIVRLRYASLHRPPYDTYLSPYALHTSQGRQYVLDYSSLHCEERTFALSRILSLQLTPQRFSRPLRKDFFSHSIGAISGNSHQAEIVRIAAKNRLTDFLRATPLPPSQKEIAQGIFEWTLTLDEELLRYLLSFGTQATLLAPLSLRNTLRNTLQEMQQLYVSAPKED